MATMISWFQMFGALAMSAFAGWMCSRAVRSGVFSSAGLSVRREDNPFVFWSYTGLTAFGAFVAFLMAVAAAAMIAMGVPAEPGDGSV